MLIRSIVFRRDNKDSKLEKGIMIEESIIVDSNSNILENVWSYSFDNKLVLNIDR